MLNVYSTHTHTHREYRPRENISFLENGTKIYALNPKSFVFVPEKSAGDPEVDIVRTVNIPFVVRPFSHTNLNEGVVLPAVSWRQAYTLITQIVAM